LAANPALSDWLSNLRREVSVTRLTLSMLTLEDIRQLVQSLTARVDERQMPQGITSSAPPTPSSMVQFSQRLFEETKGQPFFIVQTLRLLAERDLLSQLESRAWHDREIPGSVRDLIQSRLARLSPAAQTCCAIGAVLGDGFEFDLLCHVAGLSQKEALPSLEELLNRGLWREVHRDDAPGLPLYFFSHDRIREVAYSQLSEARRRVVHQEALAALSSEAARGAPAQLARHALLAGIPRLAFQFSVEAGNVAMAVFAIGDALIHFEQAKRLLQTAHLEGEASLQPQIFELYQHLGRAYEMSNKIEQADEAYDTLLRLARERRQAVIECMALNRLATVKAHDAFNLEVARSLLQEALQVAQESDNRIGLAETEWNLAQFHFYGSKVRTALVHAERGLLLARALNHKELIARTLNILGYLRANLGHYAECQACAEEAVTLYTQLGHRAMIVDSLCLVAQAKLSIDQPGVAIDLARTALTIAQEIENPWGETNSILHLALGALETGDYATALGCAQQALALARAHQLNIVLCIVPLALGSVYQVLGQFEAARQIHLEAERFNSNIVSRPFNGPIAAALCVDCALLGAWEEAYAWARKHLDTREASLDFYSGLTFWCIVEALLHAGEIDRAEAEVAHFRERVGHYLRYRIPYLRAQAVLDIAEHQGETGISSAIAHLEEANRLAQEIGLPGTQWPILARLGELYRLVGNEAQAEQVLAQAAKIIQALAAKIDDEGLRRGFLAAGHVRTVLNAV
jgi:tetratricopeptide (TPR) repeat protein